MNVEEQISLFRNYVNERPYENDLTGAALFWRDEDILQYLNQAQVHYNALVNDLDESFNLVLQVIPITEVVNNMWLMPLDLQKIKYIRLFTSSTDEVGYEVKPINIVEMTRMQAYVPYRFYLQGNEIKFTPKLNTSNIATIEFYYLKRLPQLVLKADVSQVPMEAHENMVMYAVERGLLRDKQNTLSDSWAVRRKVKDADLNNFLKPRVTSEANTVMPRDDWGDAVLARNFGIW